MNTKLFYAPALIAAIFMAISCKKTTPNKTTTLTKPIDTVPLPNTVAKTDTIKVVAYNVLNYGDGCEGSTTQLNGYLKTIVQFAQPDLFSCEKMQEFNPVATDTVGNIALNITNNALNVVFPNRYAYCPPTDLARDTKMSVLFYNRQKLTYVNMHTIVANVSDFNLYKLYYNDPNIAITHDTTFLYVLVNHTKSGSSSGIRDVQEEAEMAALRSKFAYLPNLINMGDFNIHNSSERGYQSIISPQDTSTQMSDPAFFPDKKLTYPANWDIAPSVYPAYLTTCTRALTTVPNSCGSSGGAKSWYDHIFISPWLVNGGNYMTYIRNSYQTIGNDGHRVGLDINGNSPVANTSAPANVINALWQFSDKYPVSIKILVKANRSGGSIADPGAGY